MTRRYAALTALAGVVPLAVLGAFFVVPLAGMLELGFVRGGRLDVGGALATLGRPRVAQAVWFTLWSSAAATGLTVLLGVPTAYALHRLSVPGAAVLRGLVAVAFVLPTVVVGVAFRSLLAESGPLGRLGLDGTAAAVVAALVFFNLAVVVRVVGAWWDQVDPRPAEAAAALGASPVQVLWTVTWPALRPAVASAASVVFLFCATAFGVVLVLGGARHTTVETEIYLLTTQFLDLRAAAALSVLQLLVVVALLVPAGRLGAALPVDRAARRSRPHRPGTADVPALLATGLALALVAGPVASLVVGSLRVDGAWSVAHYRALVDEQATAATAPVLTALSNSVRTAVDATAVALVLGVLVAVLVTRRPRSPRARQVLRGYDALFMLPLGVSAVTLGFGFLVALDEPPLDLRGSRWLVPLAQALVALPLVVRTVVPVLRGIDPRQHEAAATLGASPLRVLSDVDLALARRAVLVAAGFAFAVSLGEFGATSFLSRPDTPTLPVVVYQLVGRPGDENAGAALAASVVLGAVTAAVVLLAERLGARRTAVR